MQERRNRETSGTGGRKTGMENTPIGKKPHTRHTHHGAYLSPIGIGNQTLAKKQEEGEEEGISGEKNFWKK